MTVDLRLVVPAAAGWLAALALVFVPHAAASVAFGAWSLAVALCAGAVLWSGTRAAWRVAGLSVVAVALLATVIAVEAPARTPPSLEAAAKGGRQTVLDVRLDAAPRPVTGGEGALARWRFVGTAVRAVEGYDAVTMSVPVVVFATCDGASLSRVGFGDTVSVRGRVRSTEAGDRAAYLVSSTEAPTLRAGAPFWLSWTDGLRSSFSAAAAQLPGEGGGLLPGLSIGDVSAVGAELDAAMKTSALSHVTAVSGSNCALVTALAFAGAASAGVGRRRRAAIAVVALAAFVVLVTPDSSVVRAAIMSTIVLCSLAGGRPSRGLPALGLAVLVLLLLDPWKAVDFGFALSVLATGGLLLLAGPLTAALSRWMPAKLAMIIAIPLAAQLACQPVLILLDATLPLYGVAANVLIEPAVPVATILGLASCLLLPVVPVVGQALSWLAWLPSEWIARVALTVDQLPASRLPWVGGGVGLVLAAVVLVLVCIRVASPAGRRSAWLSVVATIGLIGGVGVYAGSLAGVGLGDRQALPADWQIAACDVGQGDAVLVRDGDRHALVDVGRHPEPIGACLDRFGIDTLDLLVLTHFDIDHAGGLAAVVGRVDRAIVGRAVKPGDEAALDSLRRGGAVVEQGTTDLSGRLGGLAWSILWPTGGGAVDDLPSGNEGSVTVEFEGRGIRSIFLGDLGERPQDALLATGRVRPVDVVKVAHHGSADQSPGLYERLDAQIGLISVGANNGYGHPTRSLLDLLARCGTSAPRTDRQGLLVVSPPHDGGGIAVWTERAGDDGGGTYAGTDEGGTWRHGIREAPAAARRRAAQVDRRRRFPRSRGTASVRSPWSSSRAPKGFSRTGPSGCFATSSRPKTRAWRSVTSPRTTTRRASSSPWPAPPCSVSRG
ncbi:MBL fold metallo-hydrolase [Diaminobutyricibacter tongyongensis]|uniref:MBL fold metallo-hydrolase n=1 Tax=Leifsonia tongyongensis TaxID=1268043 RepID=A0A6L9XYK3_9MICO|nr:MBL fold metallo-hydrolase [Diaminobutyricibacter tongyongensis]